MSAADSKAAVDRLAAKRHELGAEDVEVGERPSGWRRTLHATLMWPPAGRDRDSYEKKRANPENYRQRQYDFHADCILRLVESAVVTP